MSDRTPEQVGRAGGRGVILWDRWRTPELWLVSEVEGKGKRNAVLFMVHTANVGSFPPPHFTLYEWKVYKVKSM